MKRIFWIILTLHMFASLVVAQKTYVGVGVALPIMEYGTLPLIAIQVGTSVADHIELRASIDTLVVFAGFLEADVLYTDIIPDKNAQWYGGGGISSLYVASSVGGIGFGLHLSGGTEFFLMPEKQTGIFIEVQPTLLFAGNESLFSFNIRSGVNFHF